MYKACEAASSALKEATFNPQWVFGLDNLLRDQYGPQDIMLHGGSDQYSYAIEWCGRMEFALNDFWYQTVRRWAEGNPDIPLHWCEHDYKALDHLKYRVRNLERLYDEGYFTGSGIEFTRLSHLRCWARAILRFFEPDCTPDAPFEEPADFYRFLYALDRLLP
jgi:hypothetical protein